MSVWRRMLAASLTLSIALSGLLSAPVAANGELDWADQYGSAQDDSGEGVAVTDEAAYVVSLNRTGPRLSFLRKYLHNGDLAWERTFGLAGVAFFDVAADATGIYVAGLTQVALPGQPTPHGQDAFIARYSAAGALVWVRQFFAGSASARLLSLTAEGLFVAGGRSPGLLKLYDRDGNTRWSRTIGQQVMTLTADATGPTVISFDADIVVTMRSFNNDGGVRYTRTLANRDYVAAPASGTGASGTGSFVGYAAFPTGGGPPLGGEIRRYDASGHVVWTRRYGDANFYGWGGFSQFGNRLYITWFETEDGPAHWAAVSATTGTVFWQHVFVVEPNSKVYPGSIAVGPRGGYIDGFVQGALEGHVNLGFNDNFLMKFTIDTTPPNILETGWELPPRVPLTIDDFTLEGKWTVSDNISGVSLVELQESSDDTTWNDVLLSEPKATSALIDVKPNEAHRFRVRATDKSGNKSAWTTSKRFQTDLLQENASGTVYDADWKPATLTGANGGSVMTTSKAGATATLSFTGDAVGLVMTKGPHRGKVDIYLDGTKLKTLDLYAPSLETNWMVFSRNFASVKPHLLTLVALGTNGRPRIDIDAFEVRATVP